MTTFHSLSHLLLQSRDDREPVAWCRERVWVWADLRRDVARLAQALSLRPAAVSARRCALFTDSAYWFAVGLLAAFQARKAVLLLPNAQPQTLKDLAEQDVLLTDRAELCVAAAALDVSVLAAELPVENREFVALDLAGCAVDIYTSGSTGAARCIHKTLAHFDAEVAVLEQLWGAALTPAHRVLGSVSHQHVYGVLFRVLWPLCAGRAFDAQLIEYPEQIESYRGQPVVLVSSPALLKRVADDGVLAIPALIFSSGGPLDEAVSLNIQARWQTPVWEIFGSTETGGVAVRNRQQSVEWTLMPGVTAQIDVDGILQVASAHVASGEERMGDRAELIGERQIRLLGRTDRIVKLEEKRISLSAVENRLREHMAVANAYALVLDGARQQLAVVVELTAAGYALVAQFGEPALKQQLRAWLAQAFEPVTLPRRWRFVANLPLTAQGKFDRQSMEQLFVNTVESATPAAEKLPRVLDCQRTENKCVLQLQVPQDCSWFDGHFPQVPILSGVAQIDWVMTLAERYLDVRQGFAGIEVLKFQNIIQPGNLLQLELEYVHAKNRLYFSMQNDRPLSSGRVILAAEVSA